MAEKKLIAVFTDESTTCSVGTVDCVTPEEVRLATLSRFGVEAGYDVIRISKIHRIDCGSSYEKSVECLQKGFDPQDYSVSLRPSGKSISLIRYTLEQARDTKIVVSLYDLEGGCLTGGFVESVTINSVTIKAINDYGYDDGICTVPLENIHEMTCNSHGDRALAYLNQKRGD